MATITAAAVTPVLAPFNTTPSYSGTFIPSVWSSKLNVKFYAATTFGDVSNTNWEGDIKSMGDKVVINNIPSINIKAYSIGATLQYDVPTPNTIELQVDQGYYFGVNVSDVLEYQAQPNLMDMFTTDAANQMKIQVDRECLQAVVTGCDPANVGATAGKISGSYSFGTDAVPVVLTGGTTGNILQTITAMASALDEQNVPETGRWIVLPAWMGFILKSSDLKLAYLTGDDKSPIRTGKIGTIDRFTVYLSNNYEVIVDTGKVAPCECLFGTKDAISFASQITNVETLRSQTTFGNIVRGLNVFGYKDTKPEAMGVVYVAQS